MPDTSAAYVLEMTRLFDAPRHLVFSAWTKKELLDQWSAPRGFTIPFSEGEARTGGAWRSVMRSPQGEEYKIGGTYQEVVEDSSLRFTHYWEDESGQPDDETTVTVRLTDAGGQTEMHFAEGTFATPQRRDSHRGGWSECFEKLAELLARQGHGAPAA